MSKKSSFHRKHSDPKIKVYKYIYAAALLLMFGIVLHDSFVHALPFYYVLYGIGGVIVGRFVALTYEISLDKEKNIFHIRTSRTGIIVLLLLLAFRFFAGKVILEGLHVIWATDVIYLIFIGIYYAKLQSIVKQMDERVYEYIREKIIDE